MSGRLPRTGGPDPVSTFKWTGSAFLPQATGDNPLWSGPSSAGDGYGGLPWMGYGEPSAVGYGDLPWMGYGEPSAMDGYGDLPWMEGMGYASHEGMGYAGQPGVNPFASQPEMFVSDGVRPSHFPRQMEGNHHQQYKQKVNQLQQTLQQERRELWKQERQKLLQQDQLLQKEYGRKLQQLLQQQKYYHQEQQLMQEEKQEMALEIKVPNHIEVSNMRFMIPTGQEYLKVKDTGYINFATTQAACLAQFKWMSNVKQGEAHELAKKKGYDIKCITSEEYKKLSAESAATSTSDGLANKRVRKVKSVWTHQNLSSDQFDWCTLHELSLQDHFVKPFKFAAAAKYGSVSSDLVLCEATDVGNLVFLSLLTFTFAQHLSGRTYKGNIKLEDLVFSKKLRLCAIIKETFELSDPLDAQADVDGIVDSLLPLYKINDNLPPYYEYMVKRSKKAPQTVAEEALKKFHEEMVRECCFVPKEIRVIIVKESHVYYKNLVKQEKAQYDHSAPTCLEDWMPITKVDKLLFDVISDGITLGAKFADEGSHIRHLVEHAPDKFKALKVLFPLIERDMLMFYYFKKYLPEFVELMYKERDNQEWLNELCESYEHGRLVIGTIPPEAIPLSLHLEYEDSVLEKQGTQKE